jgi:hypothetical protein
MTTIPDNAEFVVSSDDAIQFTTKTNGDTIRMINLHLDVNNAAALARLINLGVDLIVEIKENV